MSTALPNASLSSGSLPDIRWPLGPLKRLSVRQYHDLVDAGVIDENEHVELLDGLLVEKLAPRPPHTFFVQSLFALLTARLPAGWSPRAEQPLTLSPHEPEPDLAIVRGDFVDYFDRRPEAADTAFVCEVSDTTLQRDLAKAAIYAAAAIPVYLLLDVAAKTLRLHRDPVAGEYTSVAEVDVVEIALGGERFVFTRDDIFGPLESS